MASLITKVLPHWSYFWTDKNKHVCYGLKLLLLCFQEVREEEKNFKKSLKILCGKNIFSYLTFFNLLQMGLNTPCDANETTVM